MGKKTSGGVVYLLAAAVGLAGTSCRAHGQTCAGAANVGAKLPQFDVATIKPFGKSGMAGVLTYPSGRVVAGHLNLRMLLMFACDVQPYARPIALRHHRR